ncbi:prkC [Symbiodinium necroappetens]|uniref:NEK6-subfamily protein kinase n=1 Tax=Symbiodinium necroappetens TaxID=1628268 RepID=A0A812R9A2_9DINO|nr:prkC [Symbiodinium necroappetens]
MRHVAVDYARRRKAAKRGEGWQRVTLSSVRGGGDVADDELLDLNDALERLERASPRQASVVEMRFFGEMTNAQVAEALGVSERTVQLDWRAARAWIRAELDGERDREAFLDEACAGDPALRRDVERLLAYDGDSSEFLPRGRRAAAPPAAGDAPPRRIGRYAVESVVGRGGMGVVYLCTQDTPVRTVAVKLLRAAWAGDAEASRLQREGQFLASLQHPNIAHVFDAGVAEVTGADGSRSRQPFVAMEHVDGVPIDKHAEAAGLGDRERWRLLADVCDAVRHAHQRAVIHRDLKPSNILVDGDGRARVLDFGIAADAGERRDGPRPGLTGTLAYMSPEQLANPDAAPDTRSDVYALGVTAYKLLTGVLPHDLEGLTLAEALATVRSTPARPPRAARPDLPPEAASCIERAIACDPEARYASAEAFAEDIRALLTNRPVGAHGRSFAYVGRKFASRHAGALAGVAVACVAVLTGLALMGFGYVRAERARAEAEANAANQRAMATYLEAVIFGADPELGGAGLSYIDAIGHAANRIDDTLIEHPVAEAHARSLVGFVLRRHGRYAEADAHLRQALRLRLSELGEGHPLTAKSRQDLAMLIFEHAGAADEAAALMAVSVEAFAGLPGHASEEAWARTALGSMRLASGQRDAALAEFEEAERLMRRAYPGPFSFYAGYPARGRAEVYIGQGRHAEALALVREATQRVGATPSSEYLLCLLRLTEARAALGLGELDGAARALDEAERSLATGLDADHPYRAELLIERAALAMMRDDFEAASRAVNRAHAIRLEHLASSHWMLDETRVFRSLIAFSREGTREVYPLHDPATKRLTARLGQTHPRILWIMRTAARLAERAGDTTRAEMLREWLDKAEQRAREQPRP